mgnify:CR=1 FL=1
MIKIESKSQRLDYFDVSLFCKESLINFYFKMDLKLTILL